MNPLSNVHIPTPYGLPPAYSPYMNAPHIHPHNLFQHGTGGFTPLNQMINADINTAPTQGFFTGHVAAREFAALNARLAHETEKSQDAIRHLNDQLAEQRAVIRNLEKYVHDNLLEQTAELRNLQDQQHATQQQLAETQNHASWRSNRWNSTPPTQMPRTSLLLLTHQLQTHRFCSPKRSRATPSTKCG